MTTLADADQIFRVIAGLVTVLGSCAGAIYLLVRYQRTFIGAQDDEIVSLRTRLDEVVTQLDDQRRKHDAELDAMRHARLRCEGENAAMLDRHREMRLEHAAELERLENEIAALRRQLGEALEYRLPYTRDDNPGTRSGDVHSKPDPEV